ncbi:hypothetical protein, variant [Capsaspora owczarzaki ATCC 30864]|uniref:SF3 helicase domain-containing protein n=1 Tax=Capsaspora owczarzaki (strain ATCC 30864) TaxID=595528 RepID=A0A0D2WYJ6_CAPO3|nr:hypothetical protein, variant [Capsaspora owczarzaki ATCC 30864]
MQGKNGRTSKAELLTLAAEKNHSFIFKIGNSWFESCKDHAAFTEDYEKLKSNQKCHMEVVLAGKPVKPYFDIELKRIDERFDQADATGKVFYWIKESFEKYYNVKIMKKDIAACDASNESKFSLRVIINKENVYFKDNATQQEFIRIAIQDADECVKKMVDCGVYDKDRAMRVCGSFKDEDGSFVRPFKSKTPKHGMSSFLITNPVGTTPLQSDTIDALTAEAAEKRAQQRAARQIARGSERQLKHWFEEAEEILMDHLGPEYYNDYQKWFNVLAVIKTVFGDTAEAYDLCKRFSAQAGNKEWDEKFDGFWERNLCADNGWTMKTLYKMVGGSSKLKCNEKVINNLGDDQRDAELLAMLLEDRLTSVSVQEKEAEFYLYDEAEALWKKKVSTQMNVLVSQTMQKYLQGWIDEYKCKISEASQLAEEKIDQKTRKVLSKAQMKELVENEEVKGLEGTLRRLNDLLKNAGGKQKAAAITHKLQTLLYDAQFKVKLDSAENLLPIADRKVVDLTNGEVRDRMKEDYFSLALSVSYEPGKGTAVADKFFSEIMLDRADRIEQLRLSLGYSLFGHNKSNLMFFLYGPDGSNGKSLLLNILTEIVGEFRATVDPSIIIGKTRLDQSASPYTMQLIGKRLGFMSELPEESVLNEAMVKQLTGADVMTARQNYGNAFEFSCYAKMLLATNYLPNMKDSPSLWRRVRMVKFDACFVENPTGSQKKINVNYMRDIAKPNINQFFTWMVNGAIEYSNKGTIEVPADITAFIKGLRLKSNPVKLFIDKCVVFDKPDASQAVKRSDIYGKFTLWMQSESDTPTRLKKSDFLGARTIRLNHYGFQVRISKCHLASSLCQHHVAHK